MLRKLRPRSAYDVMAALALFLVVTGGTAFAVVAANQVNSASIINGQVKTADLGADSVVTGKVSDGSLLRQDFKAGQLSARGAAGGALAGSYPAPTIRAAAAFTEVRVGAARAAAAFTEVSTFTLRWFNAGYAGFNSSGFYRDRLGIVHLKGLARCNDTASNCSTDGSSNVIFRLPPGYRPASRYVFDARTGAGTGRVDVFGGQDSSPGVVAFYSGDATSFVSLDGISFRAG